MSVEAHVVDAAAALVRVALRSFPPPDQLEYIPISLEGGEAPTAAALVVVADDEHRSRALALAFPLLLPLNALGKAQLLGATRHAPDRLDAANLLLLTNPFHATAWNVRKEAVCGALRESGPPGSHAAPWCAIALAELRFSSLVLSRHPKSSEAWAHRWWLLRTALLPLLSLPAACECGGRGPPPVEEGSGGRTVATPPCAARAAGALLAGEVCGSPPASSLSVCEAACRTRARCYPAWIHRGKVLVALVEGASCTHHHPCPALRSQVLALLHAELGSAATLARAKIVPRDYSVWHHRGLVLRLLGGMTAGGGGAGPPIADLLTAELDLVVEGCHGSPGEAPRWALQYHERTVRALAGELGVHSPTGGVRDARQHPTCPPPVTSASAP